MTAVTRQRVALLRGAGLGYVTGFTEYTDGGHAAFNGVVIRSA